MLYVFSYWDVTELESVILPCCYFTIQTTLRRLQHRREDALLELQFFTEITHHLRKTEQSKETHVLSIYLELVPLYIVYIA